MAVKALYEDLIGKGYPVWYDEGLIAGQPFRAGLLRRIEAVNAVVALWTKDFAKPDWVCTEAGLATNGGKLICLRDPDFDPGHAPPPFNELHMAKLGDWPALLKALEAKAAKPKV